jgi:hypothetical protein
VTAKIFRHRVDDQVRAQFKRTLQVWRGKGVVHYEQGLIRVRLDHIRDNADVRHCKQGISGGFQPDDARGRRQRVGEILRVGCVGKCKVQAEAAQDLIKEPKRPAVNIISRHHMVAARQQSQDRIRRSHSRRECKAECATFKRRETILQSLARGIQRARIFVTLTRPADAILHVRGCEIDRRHHRAVIGVGFLSRMDGKCFEFHGVSYGVTMCGL